MTEQERFLSRFDDMRAKGLVDIKFFVNRSVALTSESVSAAANRLLDSLDRGEHRGHRIWGEEFEQRNIRQILQ